MKLAWAQFGNVNSVLRSIANAAPPQPQPSLTKWAREMLLSSVLPKLTLREAGVPSDVTKRQLKGFISH